MGSRPAEYTIEYDETLPLRIVPRKGVLSERGQLGSSQQTHIEFIGDDAGPFRAPARVLVSGDPHPRLVDINANVMEQTIDLVMPNGGGIVSNIDFGPSRPPLALDTPQYEGGHEGGYEGEGGHEGAHSLWTRHSFPEPPLPPRDAESEGVIRNTSTRAELVSS